MVTSTKTNQKRTGIVIRERGDRHGHTEEGPRDGRGRARAAAACTAGTPEAGRRGEDPSLEPSEAAQPCAHLLDVHPPELAENAFLLL